VKFVEDARMNFRTGTRLLLATCALAVSACSSSTPSPSLSTGTGSPDGSANGNPSDAGSASDAPSVNPFDAAGTIGDASITNGGDAAGYGDGGSFDFGCGGNGDCPLSQVCCTSVGPPITFACVDPATCPAPDKIECDGPDECGASAPICCGVAVANGTGSFPACGASTLGASCSTAAACPTFIGNCSQTSTLQVCHSHLDCTDTTNGCCTFSGDGGAQLSFCFNSTEATAAGGVCH
jgi:hypothetical protein